MSHKCAMFSIVQKATTVQSTDDTIFSDHPIKSWSKFCNSHKAHFSECICYHQPEMQTQQNMCTFNGICLVIVLTVLLECTY